MNLEGKNLNLRKHRPPLQTGRIFILLGFILAGLFLIRGIQDKQIEPLFLPTAYPTRTANSYAEEGNVQFDAGNLDAAISAYQKALELDAQNGPIAAELARIQTYYSALKTTEAEKLLLLEQAMANTDQAKAANPDNSTIRAIRSFVLDWYSNPDLVGTERSSKLLIEANQEAIAAIQLDNRNGLALAYYAEILNDQQNWQQAEQYIDQAMQIDTNHMDVFRVHGLLMETQGKYNIAIESYKKAIALAPNLTFIYIRIGVNYRQLQNYDMALSYFEQAATINKRININDPMPYLAIGRTYAQMGEFFGASRNVMRALELNPTQPDMYGQLGVIYFKARNYEGAIPALKCVVRGCTAEESCEVRLCNSTTETPITIEALPLSNSTLEYYEYYSSALAGMHRPNDNNCIEAMDVLQQIRSKYSQDNLVMKLVQTNENICSSIDTAPTATQPPIPTTTE